MPTGGKKPTGTAKVSTGAKPKQPATSKPTKTDNTTQNNTSVGSDQDFLFTGRSLEQKEDEWLNKFQHLMKIKKNKVDESSKFSDNLKRLYDALLKELSIRCGQKYESMFDTADDGHSEIEMTMNVTPRDNTKGKVLSDKCSESSAKHQELTEENNKLKDQLKIYQDNLKKFEKQADDYKKEVDAKTAYINQLKQNISEMKKPISETEKQQKLTKPPEKTGVDTLNLQMKNENQEKTDSSNKELIERLTTENVKLPSQTQQMQQKIDALTKEKADVLKQKENLEKGNVTQGKTDSSNKEQITRLTDENEKIKLKHKELEQQHIKLQEQHIQLQQQHIQLQQQQREESQSSKEKINILTAEKESLETVVSQIAKQLEEEKRKINKELWEVTGMKLTEGNPAIDDLGDPNRPTQLGEKFAEMYDNEWTDAMEELVTAGDEKSNINTLKTIVEKSYEFGKSRAASYVKGLEKAFLDLSNGIEVTDIISKYIKNHRKNTALLVLDGLYKSFVSDHSEYNVGGDRLKSFIKKAVSLCWLMAIQDPPVVLTTKHTGKFDTDRFRHFTKYGSTVDYVVWPVLFLHEGGPVICKGVAQGK